MGLRVRVNGRVRLRVRSALGALCSGLCALCSAVPCRVAPCHAVQCCAAPCCAVPCRVAPCCAV
eukprot:865130-Alexandrium_andersonii.AAC.1